MNNDYMTAKDRLIFIKSKHDKTDKAFVVVMGCLCVVMLAAQVIKWVVKA